ncbi:hypothetical protein [Aquibacillus salsiterrae]|uniref:DUF3951 domain-containing protein n=1 Tax=Aquibacillus salsiterrae TaxID=2950439 RepID=A0A9X3WB51_9BACI|nr:hypothetical protein [Aquibacillus salsiterrae]MDC3416225.1 hypothetical protein [Aquibacillus salsiterrae]
MDMILLLGVLILLFILVILFIKSKVTLIKTYSFSNFMDQDTEDKHETIMSSYVEKATDFVEDDSGTDFDGGDGDGE